MKVGTGGNLGLSSEYHKKLFGPLFYTWWKLNADLFRLAGRESVKGVEC